MEHRGPVGGSCVVRRDAGQSGLVILHFPRRVGEVSSGVVRGYFQRLSPRAATKCTGARPLACSWFRPPHDPNRTDALRHSEAKVSGVSLSSLFIARLLQSSDGSITATLSYKAGAPPCHSLPRMMLARLPSSPFTHIPGSLHPAHCLELKCSR